jgi:hypothetical protein
MQGHGPALVFHAYARKGKGDVVHDLAQPVQFVRVHGDGGRSSFAVTPLEAMLAGGGPGGPAEDAVEPGDGAAADQGHGTPQGKIQRIQGVEHAGRHEYGLGVVGKRQQGTVGIEEQRRVGRDEVDGRWRQGVLGGCHESSIWQRSAQHAFHHVKKVMRGFPFRR